MYISLYIDELIVLLELRSKISRYETI
jgi:hypothetical protein